MMLIIIGTLLGLFGGLCFWLQCRGKPFPLCNHRVLITGAGSGIGREMALAFARAGADLVLWDIQSDSNKETLRQVKSVTSSRIRACCATVDVSDPDQIKQAIIAMQHQDTNSPVSVLVNNAGVVSGKTLLELSDADIRRTVGVNLMSHFWMTRAFLPDMLQLSAKGSEAAIVTISSLMGQMAGVALGDYCASKWGVNGMHEALRLELRANPAAGGIHTMLVCPYMIDTGMFDGAFEGDDAPFLQRRCGLFPKLRTRDVAQQVLDALVRRERVVVLPRIFRFVPPLLQLLPATARDWICEFAGARHGMKQFGGRQQREQQPQS